MVMRHSVTIDGPVYVHLVNVGIAYFMSQFFLLLFALKMGVGDTQVREWSWWWVTAPLWAPPIGAMVLALGRVLLDVVGDRFEKR